MAWRVCQAFDCTPDVALRLLDRRHRPWTLAVMDAGLAERLVDDFNRSKEEGQAKYTVGRWTPGMAAFFQELMTAAKGEDNGDGG